MNAEQDENDLVATFERLPGLLERDADLIRRGAFFRPATPA